MRPAPGHIGLKGPRTATKSRRRGGVEPFRRKDTAAPADRPSHQANSAKGTAVMVQQLSPGKGDMHHQKHMQQEPNTCAKTTQTTQVAADALLNVRSKWANLVVHLSTNASVVQLG